LSKRVKDDYLVERIRGAMRHLDDAAEKAKVKEYDTSIRCDLEDAFFDLQLAFYVVDGRDLRDIERAS
jgi:hypothetical protein